MGVLVLGGRTLVALFGGAFKGVMARFAFINDKLDVFGSWLKELGYFFSF
jgi:hypothetical protein